jgi:hypothetical protein
VKDGRPELPHHDGDAALRIVGQHAHGGAVVFHLPLDDLAVGQADAKGEEPPPTLVQGLQVEKFGRHAGSRAYRKSSL